MSRMNERPNWTIEVVGNRLRVEVEIPDDFTDEQIAKMAKGLEAELDHLHKMFGGDGLKLTRFGVEEGQA